MNKKNDNNLLANFSEMCAWEQEKAMYLLGIAKRFKMNISGYGELAVNPKSSNTYLWLEDYNFTLYMPIICELEDGDVTALYTCPECGEEYELDGSDYNSVSDIEKWIGNLFDGDNCKKCK